MKFWLIIISLIFISNISRSSDVAEYCSQGQAPIKLKQVLSGTVLTVTFKPTTKLEKFQIERVRPMGNFSIIKFQEQNIDNALIEQLSPSEVEITPFSELVYVVFDLLIKKDGRISHYSIPVALGNLSDRQKKDRSKKVKMSYGKGHGKKDKNGNELPLPPDVLIHEMHE